MPPPPIHFSAPSSVAEFRKQIACHCEWWGRVVVVVHGKRGPIKILSLLLLYTVCHAMSWGEARYVKHVLGRIYVVFTLLGYWAQGRFPRDWYITCLCRFSLYTAQKSKFSKLIFLIS